jgi:hypothetical protein
MQKAIKIMASRGKTKAGDFDPATQALLKVVISCYRGRLCNENPYPDPMLALTWAKLAWNDACQLCDSHIRYTSELLKLVTDRDSHLRGQVKSKVHELVAEMYGFQGGSKPATIAANVKLARELKERFAFVYHIRFLSLSNAIEH